MSTFQYSHILKMKRYIDKLERLGHLCHMTGRITEGVKKKPWKNLKGESKEKKKIPPPLKKESVAKDGMRSSRRLEKSFMVLHMGNVKLTKVEAIGSYFLNVPGDMKLCLEECHYSPSVTRGIIFVSLLRDDGFELAFMHYGIFVSKNNMFYFNVFPRNGIFEIDMDGVISIDKYVFHVAKRTKYDLSKTYLWHCRLDHLNKQRIKKLQSEGILESTRSDLFDVCEQCICGKITKNPLFEIVNRAKDLLRLVHSDVCGPFRVHTRDGDTYFVTITGDFSRYDRGGEYLSQKFLDHLAEYGIVSQRMKYELSVKGYINASFQTDRDDTKSQSVYVFIMNGWAVAWRSSKQDTIAMSSTEVEYIVVSEAAQVIKVDTDDNNVDPLTKALPCDKHDVHVNGMGL
ncbi:retrotransposon protein, putative, ty1-copia subclass [Tanacetum coccineum]